MILGANGSLQNCAVDLVLPIPDLSPHYYNTSWHTFREQLVRNCCFYRRRLTIMWGRPISSASKLARHCRKTSVDVSAPNSCTSQRPFTEFSDGLGDFCDTLRARVMSRYFFWQTNGHFGVLGRQIVCRRKFRNAASGRAGEICGRSFAWRSSSVFPGSRGSCFASAR